MKNKQVKQMICDVVNEKLKLRSLSTVLFKDGALQYIAYEGYEIEHFAFIHSLINAKVSLTANQLKGK